MGSAPTVPVLIRFGVFEADLRAGELRRSGVRVRLQDLPFRALTLLLSRPGEVISHEEFRQALWGDDVFVDFERSLRSAIKRLRDAVGDDSENPIFIETVERRGYRWIGPVLIPEPPPAAEPIAQQTVPQDEAKPQDTGARKLAWRSLIYALPVLALLLAIWMFRGGHHAAQADTKSVPPPPAGLHRAANPRAEDLYLKGRYYWNKRTPESLNQAVDAFNKAIEQDPNYSDAYVGLADCYNLLREFSAMPQNEAYFKAFMAAKKAVDLDPNSSEAHTSLAFVTFWGMWDAVNAEKEFRRAIALDPQNSKAHHWYATFLQPLGRNDEALAEIELARKLEPNSPSILADKGDLLRAAGEHDQAVELLKQLEAAEPDFVSPHRYLGLAYLDVGDYPNYIAELKLEAHLTHDPATSAVAEAAARGFARGGKHSMLQSQLAEQLKLVEQKKVSPCVIAQTEALLGDHGNALEYLRLCVESHDEQALAVAVEPPWSGYNSDPAFRQLIAKIGVTALR